MSSWFCIYSILGFYLILLQFIVFAKLLFTSLQSLDLSDCCSVPWWLFRISMFQQNILDDLSSSLFDQVQVYKNKMLDHFGELEKVSTYWDYLLSDGEGSYVVSAAFLEAGIVEYKYGRVDASRSFCHSQFESFKFPHNICSLLKVTLLNLQESYYSGLPK